MKSKLAGILLALVLFAAPVAAEEVEVNGTTEIRADAGVAPDSPFYGLENALERVRLALTFNEQRRAERALDYADERLAEIREMVEEGKFEAAQRARMRYEQKLEAAAEATERVESDSSDDRAREALEASTRVRAKLQLRLQHAADVHEEILERQAERLSDEQLAQLEDVFGAIYNRTDEADERIERKRVEAKTRAKVLANLSDDEADALAENISQREGLEQRLEQRAERLLSIIEKREAMLENDTSNRSAVARMRLRMVLDDQLERIEMRQEIRNDRLRERIRGEIRARIGEERFRERFRDDRDRDEQEIEVEIESDRARVQITLDGTEREIQIRSTDREEIVSMIAQRLNVTEERVRSIIEFETDDESDENEIEIEVEVENGTAYVEATYNGTSDTFRLDADTRANIVRAIAQRTGLSVEEIRANIEFEREDERDENEIEIEVEVENGIAYVETEINGTSDEYRLELTDRAELIEAIASKSGLSRALVRDNIEIELSDDDADEREVEIEVELGDEAYVTTKINGKEDAFVVTSTDRAEIISEIAAETGLTRAQVRARVEWDSDADGDGYGDPDDSADYADEDSDADGIDDADDRDDDLESDSDSETSVEADVRVRT